MATENSGAFPFQQYDVDPISEEYMALMDDIAGSRVEISEHVKAFAARPFPVHAKRIGMAVTDWLHSINDFAEAVDEHQPEEAPALMANLFLAEDAKRVAMLNQAINSRDQFKPSKVDFELLTREFSPVDDDEGDALDLETIQEAFFGAARYDYDLFESYVTSNLKGRVISLLPTIGRTALDIAKITAGTSLAIRLTGFGRKKF